MDCSFLSLRPAARALGLAAALLASASCARGPTAVMAMAPLAHGHHVRQPGPQAIGWRANALAAPCALHCTDGHTGRGIACSCGAVDTIYLEHLSQSARAQAQANGAQ